MKCQVFCHWLLITVCKRAGGTEILYMWVRRLNKELHSCYASLNLQCCRVAGGKGSEVLLVKKERPFALIATHFPGFGQL